MTIPHVACGIMMHTAVANVCSLRIHGQAAARAALGLSGSKVHGRPIRVERCKAMARSANASAAKARVHRKGTKVPLSVDKPKGAVRASEGAAARRGPRVGAGAFVPVSKAPWQGTRTSAGGKGGKGVVKLRGAPPAAQRAAAAEGRQQVGRRKAAGKRPSVLARKQKQRAAARGQR